MKEQKRIRMKRALRFAACLLPAAVVGGYFTGNYVLASYSAELRALVVQEVGSAQAFSLIVMVQSALYAVFGGAAGWLLAEKLKLARPLRFARAALRPTLLVTAACGAVMALDCWTFGAVIPGVRALYEDGTLYRSADNWISSVLYGGVVEEVLMRLLVMSLLGLLFWKLAARDLAEPPQGTLIAANAVSALLFAAGHLPTAAGMFGALSPLLVLRILVLNAALGAAYGRLYRRYGIQYAMLAHAGTHILSKLVWLALL